MGVNVSFMERPIPASQRFNVIMFKNRQKSYTDSQVRTHCCGQRKNLSTMSKNLINLSNRCFRFILFQAT